MWTSPGVACQNRHRMRTYGQYCPIARGAEIFAERWTPVIIRNLHLGCRTFGELLQGAPGLSRTMLSRRLTELERAGVVDSSPKPGGRGRVYTLTAAGEGLWEVCDALGNWGARWLELAPEHLDPGFALWSMCNRLDRDRLPTRTVVTEINFTDRPERFWLVLQHGTGEVCREFPGADADLFVIAETEALIRWHLGQLSWAEATREGRITVHGPAELARAFPTWNMGSPYADGVPSELPYTPSAGSSSRLQEMSSS